MVVLKQSCCRKRRGQKRKTPKTAENTGMPQKTQRSCPCGSEKNMLSIRLSTEARCFFVVRSETERVRLRSKLGQCPKMMVGMLLEGCGKTKPT